MAKRRREVPVSETEDGTVFKNCVTESKQREEKNREYDKIVRHTMRKRIVSEKKKVFFFFFFFQVISLMF